MVICLAGFWGFFLRKGNERDETLIHVSPDQSKIDAQKHSDVTNTDITVYIYEMLQSKKEFKMQYFMIAEAYIFNLIKLSYLNLP